MACPKAQNFRRSKLSPAALGIWRLSRLEVRLFGGEPRRSREVACIAGRSFSVFFLRFLSFDYSKLGCTP
jgi:hypothetical protein